MVASVAVAAPAAEAHPACTLLAEAESGRVIRQDGDCDQRVAAASTFKVPLALIGFQSGVLRDAHHPSWPYRPEYAAPRESHRHDTDPARWMAESVLWYSRQLTRRLGMAEFQRQVDALGYGNCDLSGGLERAWLSSLRISPREQVAFLRRLLAGTVPVSAHAIETTRTIVPVFAASGGWTVHGKTGTGFETADGRRQLGWFVGWAERDDGRRVAFAVLSRDEDGRGEFAGLRLRDEVLRDFVSLAAQP